MITDTREYFRQFADPAEFERFIERDSVSEMWKVSVRDFAGLTAVVYDGVSYTYGQLESDAALIRPLLSHLEDGARVALLAANSYDFVKAFIAIVTSGKTAVVMPAHLPKEAVAACCAGFGVQAIIYQPRLAESVSLAAVEKISTDSRADEPLEMSFPKASDPCVMMFTGGTTGKSKCALLSNGAVMQGVLNGCYGVKPVFNQRYLLVLPLSHVFGLIRNLLTSLYTGSTLYICKNNKDMFKDIAVFKPTVLVLVPALAEMALTLSKQFKRNLLGDDLKYIIAGAAIVSPYLIEEYDRLGIKLLQGYGLTESANLVSGNPESLTNPESIGMPYPNQELKIVDGELWLKGKNMMDGYVGVKEEGIYEDGWFKTGDLVRQDERGFLYITGRIKEIIVLPSGENISPAELENRFNTLPLIQDSQVFEDVSEGGRHFLALEVVPRKTVIAQLGLKDPVKEITEQLQKINRELPAFQQVQKITVRDSDFERTPSMKIVRYKK